MLNLSIYLYQFDLSIYKVFIAGCLKLTTVRLHYLSAGVAPSDIRRAVVGPYERAKMAIDIQYLMYGHGNSATRDKKLEIFVQCVAQRSTEH